MKLLIAFFLTSFLISFNKKENSLEIKKHTDFLEALNQAQNHQKTAIQMLIKKTENWN